MFLLVLVGIVTVGPFAGDSVLQTSLAALLNGAAAVAFAAMMLRPTKYSAAVQGTDNEQSPLSLRILMIAGIVWFVGGAAAAITQL